MSEADIAEVKARFINTALLAQRLGFDGVQIHAAHGYLLSQFLSPLTNQRSDRWGGSLENRARLLLEIVQGIREQVGERFSLSVKLNSADFQRGGFSTEDARAVVDMLNPLGVDLVELSGGSYEAPAMHGQARDGRTTAREAYFLTFAEEIVSAAHMPVMVTGGIRRYPVVEQVLGSGVAVVGMATALAIAPDLPARWRREQAASAELRPILAQQGVGFSRLYGDGEIPAAAAGPWSAEPPQGCAIAGAGLPAVANPAWQRPLSALDQGAGKVKRGWFAGGRASQPA